MAENNDLLAIWAQVRALEPDLDCARSVSRPREGLVAESEGEHAVLVRLIETQVVPRLMLSHRSPAAQRESSRKLGPEDVAEFARISVAHDASTARLFCEQIEAEGVELDRLLLDLFAPAARLLGELWASDRCTFADVTVGLSVLQRLLRERGVELSETVCERRRGRAVLAPVPGEQHTLGLQMVADFLRRDGWDTSHIPLATRADILTAVRSEWVDVLGLGVSNSTLVLLAGEIIEEARAASRNPDVVVAVGGAGPEHRDAAMAAGAEVHASSVEELIDYLRERFEPTEEGTADERP